MSKVDDKNAVESAINEIINKKLETHEDIYIDTLPTVAYFSAYLVGKRLQHIGYTYQKLFDTLKVMPQTEWHFAYISINIENIFNIYISDKCKPEIFVKNARQICDLQSKDKLDRYTAIDEDVIFTNSTLHIISVYKKCVEFVTKEEIIENDILDLFQTMYDTALKYVPIMQNLETWIEENSDKIESSQEVTFNTDLEKYFITCNHTALKTGAWDE